MREIEFNGNKVTIPDEIYEKLLLRFNPVSAGDFKCVLCEDADTRHKGEGHVCSFCLLGPLDALGANYGDNICAKIASRILGRKVVGVELHIFSERRWSPKMYPEGSQIFEWLTKLPEVSNNLQKKGG